MRRIISLSFGILTAVCCQAQTELVPASKESSGYPITLYSGIINGEIRTTDGKPASSVTVYIRENNRITLTDDKGHFSLKNLREGTYTIEVSMVGLVPQQKTITITKDQAVDISFVLAEDARQLSNVLITTGRRLNNKPASIGKIDIHPMDLPQSLTIVGQGIIREQQAQRLSDVVRNVNGVYVTTTRGNVQESFGARGYNFGATNLFKNGARIHSGSMPEMSALEKVEVLKGSAAILFGQVAPGGILNMVTKQPKFRFGGEVSMRAGSYDLYKPSFDIYGPVSKSIAYRLNGTYENAGSYRDEVSSERFYVNPSLLFRLNEHTEILAEGDHLDHAFTPDFGIGSLDNTRIPDVPRSRFMGTSWQYSKTKQSTANISFRHQFNDQWKLHAMTGFQHYSRDYFSVERIQAKLNGDWARPLGRIDTEENYYQAQANLNGHFKTGKLEHTLLAGVDAERYLTFNRDFDITGKIYDTINTLDPGKFQQRTDMPVANAIREREAPMNRYGIYVQNLVKLSDKFNLLAGARFSMVETRAIDSTNLLTGAFTTGKGRTNQAVSPRFGIVYKPFKTTSVFASYSNSFVVNNGQDLDGNTLKPSLIDQFELGVKNEFFNGLLSANLTMYRIINNNLAQTAAFAKDGSVNSNTSIKVLTGETTSEGIELDLAAQPLKGLNIVAGYSYNYMRYTRTDTTSGSFLEGERLVNNPAHTANGSVFYSFMNGLFKGLKIGTTIAYVGDRKAGWNSDVVKAKIISQNPVTYAGPFTYRSRIFDVSGFTTIDVSAGYSYKNISIITKVSNLTNTLNWYVHENYSINPIPPTQFVATLSYKF